MSDKPLHVQVAEALGRVSHLRGDGGWWHGDVPVPRYDIDWSVTGPLIERYAISIHHLDYPDHNGWFASWRTGAGKRWKSTPAGARPPCKTPLQAVCQMIIALKELGLL